MIAHQWGVSTESVAPEAFSEVEGSELILCTRAVMIPVSRNYVGGKSQLLREDKKGILCLYLSEEPEPSYSRRYWGGAGLIVIANIF